MADTPPICAWSTIFAPNHNHYYAASEPQTRPAYMHTIALPEEPIRFGTGPPVWSGECPKHGAAARSHGTFPIMIMMWHDGRANTHPISLHIMGPSQCPLVDNPHAASIAGTLRLPAAGIVPVSPTGTVTTGSFHRIPCIVINYRTVFLWSSSFTIR